MDNYGLSSRTAMGTFRCRSYSSDRPADICYMDTLGAATLQSLHNKILRSLYMYILICVKSYSHMFYTLICFITTQGDTWDAFVI